jgi:hypothetical protein
MAFPKTSVLVAVRLTAGPGPPWFSGLILTCSLGPLVGFDGLPEASTDVCSLHGSVADGPAWRGAP